MLQFKDCWTYCNTTACNAGDEAFEVFAQNTTSNVLSCYTCEAEYMSNGTILGDSNCANMTEMNRMHDCPSYAQNSCSTGAMHFRNATDNSYFVNTLYRSCSPFVRSGNNFPNNTDLNGYEYFGYKDTCLSNNCNNKTSEIDNDLPDVYCRFGYFNQNFTNYFKATGNLALSVFDHATKR